MDSTGNPFKPTAGATPPLLVGRQHLVDELAESLDDGPGAPGRLSIFTGARGVGKTVMLTEAGAQARPRGWIVLDETATPGLLDRLLAAVVTARQNLDFTPRSRRAVTGVNLTGLGGVQWAGPEQAREVQLRAALELLVTQLESKGTGLLITIDEVHRGAQDDMRSLAATYQHLVREQRDVALVVAGLPSSVSELLNDDVLTFLRRASQHTLADVPLDEVRTAFEDTITSSGRSVSPEALDIAADATGGYPFMIQLVGYHVWRRARDLVVDAQAARAGVVDARVRLGATVHATNLASLSDIDRTYLLAMAQDDGPSRTGDIAARLGRGSNYGSVYRARLIAAGVIRDSGYGWVDFAVPYLREYLREHAASLEMDGRRPGPATDPLF